jgi:hypothetical protein
VLKTETRKDVTEALEEDGIPHIACFVSLCTVDLDVLLYVDGFPDNLWTVILYMSQGVSFIEADAVLVFVLVECVASFGHCFCCVVCWMRLETRHDSCSDWLSLWHSCK